MPAFHHEQETQAACSNVDYVTVLLYTFHACVGQSRWRIQWNLDLTKSLRTSQICSLNRGFVISENLDITNLRGNDQKVRYIEVIVNN